MSQLKRTVINMVSGGAGYFLPMLINFLATPFLLKSLGEEAFGLQSLVNVILGYLMVADMGLDVPIIKFLAEYTATKDLSNRNKLLNSSFQLYALMGCVGMLIIFLAEPHMYNLFGIPEALHEEAKIVFWITAVGFLGNIMCMWGKAVFIGIQRYDIANMIYIGFNLIASIVGILFVYNGMGVIYFVLAKIVAFFLSALSYFMYAKFLLKGYKFSFGLDGAIVKAIKPLVGYGLLMRLSSMIFSRLDQSLIGAWLGIGAVGIYSVPLLINTSITGLISGTMNYTFPRASELFSTNRIAELNQLFIVSTKYVCLSAAFFFGFLIIAGDKFISLWIGADFAAETYVALIILAVAHFILIVTTVITNNFVIAMNGMRFFTGYIVIRSVLMMIGFIVLIKPLGIIGAASGILLGSFFDILFMIVAQIRFIHLNIFDLLKTSYIKPIIAGLAAGFVLYLGKIFITDWITLILAGISYSIIFASISLVIGTLDAREKSIVLDNLRKIESRILP